MSIPAARRSMVNAPIPNMASVCEEYISLVDVDVNVLTWMADSGGGDGIAPCAWCCSLCRRGGSYNIIRPVFIETTKGVTHRLAAGKL